MILHRFKLEVSTEFCEALCWMAQLALKEREEQAAIKSTHFSQVLGLVLDEVISCMSKDWWKKTQFLKSWKKNFTITS